MKQHYFYKVSQVRNYSSATHLAYFISTEQVQVQSTRIYVEKSLKNPSEGAEHRNIFIFTLDLKHKVK